WCANGNNDATNANSNIGSRLAKIRRTEAEVPRGFGQIQNIRGLRPGRKAKHQNGAAVSRDRKWPHLILRNKMSRTYNYLFDQIADFDNLWMAYLSARKGKRFRHEVAVFSAQLEENLINIHNHLLWGTWQPGKARNFVSMEPKRREITAPPFADRVVHHAIYRVVRPLFDKKFIHHSYACRNGKGAQAAVKALQGMLRRAQAKRDKPYIMQADIKSYFASIRHDDLTVAIRKTIRCEKTLDLWRSVMSGYGFNGVGRPVGALTSQLEANIMLDQLDHHMADDCGYKYLRYMDDFIVVAKDKKEAQQALQEARVFVEGIGLRLNPKTAVFPVSAGVDWCGYRTWATHILPRKRNVKRAKARLRKAGRDFAFGKISRKEVAQKTASLRAYMKHCNGKRTTEEIIKNSIPKGASCGLKTTF
ncbi:reverse transcriptase/maturase family protein, partial [Desulfobotulus sp.]|uniref:reverse transcriptase/maturase family protein n=1 Tax=Desulfobotulus sp. TaxID=1940337 RepID=UPI002A36D768